MEPKCHGSERGLGGSCQGSGWYWRNTCKASDPGDGMQKTLLMSCLSCEVGL